MDNKINYFTIHGMTLALQLFKNSNDTRGKLRLNFHSSSVSVSELLEYGRMTR